MSDITLGLVLLAVLAWVVYVGWRETSWQRLEKRLRAEKGVFERGVKNLEKANWDLQKELARHLSRESRKPPNESCATCRFWQKNHIDWEGEGQCRRRAPVAGERQTIAYRPVWPHTWGKQWCGEYERKAEWERTR